MVGKNEKYRKTNLTNDRKTQIREENVHDTFIDVQIYFNLSMIFFDRCCKGLLGRWKRNRSWHKWTSRMSLVLKSFINNIFIMKSRDLSCDCLIGSTSIIRSVYILWTQVGESLPPMQYARFFRRYTVKCPVKAAFCGIVFPARELLAGIMM